MKSSWVKRGLLGVGVWIVAWAVLAIAGNKPQPVLLALVVAALIVTIGLGADVGAAGEPAYWKVTHRSASRASGADVRVTTLQRRLTDVGRLRSDHLFESLVGIIDDRLQYKYGVDRARDPRQARQILGPQLDQFVNSGGSQLRRLNNISSILTRIEAL